MSCCRETSHTNKNSNNANGRRRISFCRRYFNKDVDVVKGFESREQSRVNELLQDP